MRRRERGEAKERGKGEGTEQGRQNKRKMEEEGWDMNKRTRDEKIREGRRKQAEDAT